MEFEGQELLGKYDDASRDCPGWTEPSDWLIGVVVGPVDVISRDRRDMTSDVTAKASDDPPPEATGLGGRLVSDWKYLRSGIGCLTVLKQQIILFVASECAIAK